MNKTTLWACVSLSLALGILGCQQPYRCGARDEPCCNFEGVPACIPELGLSCNAGLCVGAARTACPAPGGTCDVGLQNCPAGQACHHDGAAARCLPSGSGTDGAPCTSEAQCAAGYYCTNAGNVCRRYCCGTLGCGTGQLCASGGTTGSNLGLCLVSNCDPVRRSGCPNNSACYPLVVQEGSVTTACLSVGTIRIGASCEADSGNCVPGAACFGTTCRQVCRPSNPSCASGSCTASPGAIDLGACL